MEEGRQMAYALALSVGMLGPLILAVMSVLKAKKIDELPRTLNIIAGIGGVGASGLFLVQIWNSKLHVPLPPSNIFLPLLIGLLVIATSCWSISALITRYRPYPYDIIAISSFLLAFPAGLLTYWAANAILS